MQIACTLKDVRSFLGVFPSDMLLRSVTQTGTVIINTYPHRERFTLASHTFFPKSSSAYYFDSYGILPLVPDIEAFIRRNCTVWDYNKRQLQGLTSNICGMDRGFTARQFVGQLEDASSADRQIVRAFAFEFGERGSSPSPQRGNCDDGCGEGGVQCSSSFLYKRWVLNRSFVILSYVDRRYGGCNRFRIFERAPG